MSTSQYSQGHTAASQARFGARTVESTCGYMVDKLTPNMHILDVGCGPGTITIGLARLVPQGKVIGIDRADGTLARARAQDNMPDNLSFTIGDAMDLDFPENHFDVVHTSQLVGHMQDPVHVLKQFRRVLKPGGFIACREGDQDGTIFFPETEGLRVWHDMTVRRHRATGTPLNCGRNLKAYALDAGFEVEKTRLGMGTMVFEGPSASANAETMMVQAKEDERMRNFLFQHGIADEAKLDVMVKGWDEWRKHPACVFAIMCGELIAYK